MWPEKDLQLLLFDCSISSILKGISPRQSITIYWNGGEKTFTINNNRYAKVKWSPPTNIESQQEDINFCFKILFPFFFKVWNNIQDPHCKLIDQTRMTGGLLFPTLKWVFKYCQIENSEKFSSWQLKWPNEDLFVFSRDYV